jgi:transposase InsO family protein
LRCSGNKGIVCALESIFCASRRGPGIGAEVDFKAMSHRARRRSGIDVPPVSPQAVAVAEGVGHKSLTAGFQFIPQASPARLSVEVSAERLWRTVKYEEVYLRAYSDGWEAEISLARFLWRYCHVRPHSALGGRTPHEVYNETEPCPTRPGLTMSGAQAVQ